MFEENKEDDLTELSHRLNDIRAEMEYPLTNKKLPLYLCLKAGILVSEQSFNFLFVLVLYHDAILDIHLCWEIAALPWWCTHTNEICTVAYCLRDTLCLVVFNKQEPKSLRQYILSIRMRGKVLWVLMWHLLRDILYSLNATPLNDTVLWKWMSYFLSDIYVF